MSGTVQEEQVRTAVVPLRRLLWEGCGGRLVATYWGCVVLVDLTPRGVVTVAGILVLVAACSVHLDPVGAVAVAATGWLFAVGFVSNGHGELAPHGWNDVAVLALLLLAAAGATALTRRRGDR